MKQGLVVVLGLMWTVTVGAQDAAMPPHSKMEVGQIEGTLMKDGKRLGGKDVVIHVQQNGETLLTLPKKTDDKGQFVFKNIFKDPQYSYTLLTEDNGKIYRHGPLQLSGKQEVLKVVFAVTPEAAVDMGAEPLPPESPRAHTHTKAGGQWQHYQVMALVLSVVVLVVIAYNLGRYQRRKS